MTGSLTAPLITAAALGICFAPTRWLGITATALLTIRHPWLVGVVIATAIYYVLKIRK